MLTKYAITLSRILLLGAAVLLAAGCSDNNSPTEPVNDPAEALHAQAVLVDGQFFNQIDLVRNQLNSGQASFYPFAPSSDFANETLADLYYGSQHRVYWYGLVDDMGIVRNAYPDSLDRLIGEDRSASPVVQAVLDSERVDATPVEFLPDGRRLITYYRSIQSDGDIPGALFGAAALDTLLERATTYAELNDSTHRRLFVLDDSGRIVHDRNAGLIGATMTDTTRFSIAVAALARQILDEAEGSGQFDATGGPGTDANGGLHYIGWVRRTYLNDHYLVFALTEPADS